MQIQIKDISRNGEVVVRNHTWQKKVERQLSQITERINQINTDLRSI